MKQVQEAERKRTAAELTEKSELTHREIGEVLERSPAWVAQARHQNRE